MSTQPNQTDVTSSGIENVGESQDPTADYGVGEITAGESAQQALTGGPQATEITATPAGDKLMTDLTGGPLVERRFDDIATSAPPGDRSTPGVLVDQGHKMEFEELEVRFPRINYERLPRFSRADSLPCLSAQHLPPNRRSRSADGRLETTIKTALAASATALALLSSSPPSLPPSPKPLPLSPQPFPPFQPTLQPSPPRSLPPPTPTPTTPRRRSLMRRIGRRILNAGRMMCCCCSNLK